MPLRTAPPTPRISIIIPARNEAFGIARCVQSLLRQGNEIEIIVADDSSQDRTPGIVRELAREDARVQLISVPPLADGWTGKNHALHAAVGSARGAWLLFTDADTFHRAGKLPGVVDEAERGGIALRSLSPHQETRTWWEKAVIPQVYRLLARLYPFERVNDPGDAAAAANGQFILIRREVYAAIGGHCAIKDCLLEDVELARRAKQAGFRIWFGAGEGIVSARMYTRFRDLWEGWTKNLFLLYHRDRAHVARTAAEIMIRNVLPATLGLALIFGPPGIAKYGAFLMLYALWEHLLYWRSLPGRGKFSTVLYLVPGTVIVFLLLLNSWRRYRKGEVITWKGRGYRPVT